MQPMENDCVLAELKELADGALHALARLDAERLERLAIACGAFRRRQAAGNVREGKAQSWDAGEAVCAIAVFARVMEATRGNLSLMNRIRALCSGPLEYGPWRDKNWEVTEKIHGNN